MNCDCGTCRVIARMGSLVGSAAFIAACAWAGYRAAMIIIPRLPY